MRIAIDFSTCDHLQMTAGHYRYTVQLVRGLAEIAGPQDFLLLGSGKEPVPEIRDIFGPGSHWVYRRNIPWTHRGSPYVDELAYARHFSAEPISLLHVVHNLIPLTARCPVIVTKHDLIEEMFPEYEAIRRGRLYRIHRRRVKKLTDRIICISQTTANDLKRFWGIGEDRTVVIHHGVDEDFFADPGDDLVSGHPVFRSDTLILASMYNLEPRKNLSALVEAFSSVRKSFPNARLILFGRGLITPEREEKFENLVADLGLHDSVILLGVVSDAMLRQIYRRADVFVFPSLYEGFGLPVLEALASGACVLGANTAATAEIAGEAAELVDMSDSTKIATGIAKLLRDGERRAALRRMAPQRARQFSVDAMVRRTWETYLEVLRAKRSA